MSIDYHNIITIEAGKRSGKPCIRDLRITVYDVLSWLADGMSRTEIIEDLIGLERANDRVIRQYAIDTGYIITTQAGRLGNSFSLPNVPVSDDGTGWANPNPSLY